MKYYFIIIILSLFQSAVANDLIDPVQSNKLKIIASTPDGKPDDKPEGWLRFYEFGSKPTENRIYITAVFDIPDVQAVVIKDVNAQNKKCGPKQLEFFLYLAFDPRKNVKSITTRIHKPCFVDHKAVFKLIVKTADKKSYYNVTTLTASPDAFLPVQTYSDQ